MLRNYISLHGLMLMYSLGAVCSKSASRHPFFSAGFWFFYGLAFAVLAVYAVVWQQLIKRIPLVTGYANKAVTVIWGLLWGRLFFAEAITMQGVLGAALIMTGIYIVVKSDG
ncbi:transporter [Clostridiaceae bacterium]|nr:transporter [Clostridiaceae bacterium]